MPEKSSACETQVSYLVSTKLCQIFKQIQVITKIDNKNLYLLEYFLFPTCRQIQSINMRPLCDKTMFPLSQLSF